jgi:hypothetical protein
VSPEVAQLLAGLGALLGGGLAGYRLAQVRQKPNGKELAELTQHFDLTVTNAFDQLRRDLTTTIERQHEVTRKEWENMLQRFMVEMELSVLRGDKRRKGDR